MPVDKTKDSEKQKKVVDLVQIRRLKNGNKSSRCHIIE